MRAGTAVRLAAALSLASVAMSIASAALAVATSCQHQGLICETVWRIL